MRRPAPRARTPAIAVHGLAAFGVVASCEGGWSSALRMHQRPRLATLPAAWSSMPDAVLAASSSPWHARRRGVPRCACATSAEPARSRPEVDTPAPPSGSWQQSRGAAGWRNKVPKAERMASLEAHLQHVLRRLAKSSAVRKLPGLELCLEIERRVEALYPDEDEKRVSMLCHQRLRKLGNSLRCGWENELIDRSDAELPFSDIQGLLHRLDVLGPRKQRSFMHIKQGDRIGSASLPCSDPDNVDSADYGQAVFAQSSSDWHRASVASVVEVFRGAGAVRILDIGSSFNPLRDKFPHVTAVDPVPTHESVYMANFFRLGFISASDIDGSSCVSGSGGGNSSLSGRPQQTGVCTDPADARRCVAVAENHFDGALLSIVLRSLNTTQARRDMIMRATKTLRVGGLLVIVERGKLGTLLRYRKSADPFWQDAGLVKRATKPSMNGYAVHTFERLAASGST